MSWYYVRSNETVGPVSEQRIQDLVRRGEISSSTMVWRTGMKDWQPAQAVAPMWFAAADEPPPIPPEPAPASARTRTAEPVTADSAAPRNGGRRTQATGQTANQGVARQTPAADGANEEPVLDMPDFSSALGLSGGLAATAPDLTEPVAADGFQGAAALNIDSSLPDFGNPLEGELAPVNLLDDHASGIGDLGAFSGGIAPEFVCCACGNMTPMRQRVKFQGKNICPACKARFDRLAAEGGNVFYDDAVKQAGKQTAWQVFLYALAALTMLGALGVVFAKGPSFRNLVLPMRMSASTGFLALAVACGAFKFRYGQLVFAALIFCWLGDLLLGFSFRLGLLAFLIGHVILITAFCVRGFSMEWTLVSIGIAFIFGAGVLLWLHPHVPKNQQLYVFAYMVFISVMVVFAAGTRGDSGSILILLGAVAFYFSDIFVARQCFVSSSRMNSIIGLPLYYAAVLMLAFSIKAERPDEVRILK